MASEVNKLYLSIKNDSATVQLNKEFKKILKDNLMKHGKKATGNLIKSIDSELRLEESSLSFSISAEDYLEYVDRGRKPGKYPNINAISKWAKLKGISQSAVFPIARKIKEEGIKPTNVIRTTSKEILLGSTLSKVQTMLVSGLSTLIKVS